MGRLSEHKPGLVLTGVQSVSRRLPLKTWCWLLWLPVLLGLPGSLNSQTTGSPEYYLKAAFLTNFARLVEWPASAFKDDQQPLVLCVLDPQPFGDALKAIDGKLIRGRPLRVVTRDQISPAATCHMLFANISDIRERRRLIRRLHGKPVLIVGEDTGFAEQEGMINFFIVKNKIHFEINKNKTERAGLKISSRLLKLSRIVSAGEKD